MIKINWIHEFIVLYQERSFTNAAKLLNITQSTLSKHMNHLENHLKIHLINTFNKKEIQFTEIAHELYPLFLSLMDNYTLIQNTINSKKNHMLRIGTFPSLHYYNLFNEISKQIHQHSSVHWIEKNNQTLYHQLINNELDHIIVRNPPISDDYHYKLLFNDHYSIFVSKKYFLGFKEHFYNDYLFVLLDDLFLIDPIQPLLLNKKILQFSNIQTIYSFLQQNKSITILPSIMKKYFDQSEFVNIPLNDYMTTIYSIDKNND